MNPLVSLLIVLVIGIVAGLIYDRVAGPGWFSRQFARSRRGLITSALVGIAGSFIGYHVAILLAIRIGAIWLYLGAAIGAALVLWLWRIVR